MKKKRNYTGIIVAVVVFGSLIWSLSSITSSSGPSEKEKKEILMTGTKATATLISAERTGNTVNNIHQYEYTFSIDPVSGNPFEISRKKLLDPLSMSKIEKGLEIPAYVSADGKQTLILWEKMGIKNAF